MSHFVVREKHPVMYLSHKLKAHVNTEEAAALALEINPFNQQSDLCLSNTDLENRPSIS